MTTQPTYRSPLFRIALLAAISLRIVPMPGIAGAQDQPVVYRSVLDTTEIVSGFTGSAPELPSTLVIAPGQYGFLGNAYDATEPAFYRFLHPSTNQQRIVYEAGRDNVEVLLSGFAWAHWHGSLDNALSAAALTQKATTTKLSLTCTPVSQWALSILSTYHVQARLVQSLTLDAWNSDDNGHSMIEVYRQDVAKWVLYDVDQNACFLRQGTPLSLVDMIDYSASGDYDIKYLASDATMTEDVLRTWYRRVLQVPIINGCFYLPTPNDADRARVAGYAGQNYTYLTESQFRQQFGYPLPEPSSAILALLAGAGLAAYAWRRETRCK